MASRENLGTLPALVAGAALFVDYVLTVAVSVAAGTLALASAVPQLGGVQVELALGFVGALALANCAGSGKGGIAFALPTYGFIVALLAMIAVGLARCASGGCPVASVPAPIHAGAGALKLAVV